MFSLLFDNWQLSAFFFYTPKSRLLPTNGNTDWHPLVTQTTRAYHTANTDNTHSATRVTTVTFTDNWQLHLHFRYLLQYVPLNNLYNCPLSVGLTSPEGLAVDVVRRAMFWVDSTPDKIERANLDGSGRQTLFDTDMVNPRAIIVDSSTG
jgi:Flp pilus assembly protein TadG